MPDLNTTLHLDMWRDYRKQTSLLRRLRHAVGRAVAPKDLYGLQWGDPEVFPPLQFVRNRYVRPYVSPDHVALEIGPGGGRWTRYLLGFRQLNVIDCHAELLQELKRNFRRDNMRFIVNNGCDFPGVPRESIDFVFSFACFVHLDAPLIEAYLKNIASILKRGGNAVIHYSDKSKIMAQINPNFSDNTPERMRQMVSQAGFTILEEDLTTMWHSSIIRFAHSPVVRS